MTHFERASIALISQALVNVGPNGKISGLRRVKHVKTGKIRTFDVDEISWRRIRAYCSEEGFLVYNEGNIEPTDIKIVTEERPYTTIHIFTVGGSSVRGKDDKYYFEAKLDSYNKVKIDDDERGITFKYEIS